MKAGQERVTKRRWYDTYGGFRNPHCFRKQVGHAWHYFINWN